MRFQSHLIMYEGVFFIRRRIVFPGYFREKSFKVYNPKNSFGVLIEDAFYHLNKQILRALDFCNLTSKYSAEEKQKDSYGICKAFFQKFL